MMTVREYEKIFADECAAFDELSKFVEAGEFLSLGWQRNRGAFVQAKNFVGVIHLPNGFQIEILPKIDALEDKLRGLVVEMIRTLKNFAGKKFLNASLDTARLPLHEIFIRIYLEMVLELVKRGLKSSYVLREDNLKIFKGKLLVGENLRRNFVHREKFFVAFDEYSLDRPEHRLIKSTLTKIFHTTRDNKNFRLATRLIADFDSVKASSNYRKDFAKVFIDRQNHDYKAVMEWTKIFLADESFTSFAGKSSAAALLFPMEKLFEAYVAAHVRKIFSDARFTVKTQAQEKFLFDAPRSFGLKPDILIEGDEKIIMDTKWKLEISSGDMYQMFAYSKRYGVKKIFILCPPQVDGNIFYRVENLGVKIFGIDLFDMNAAMKNLLAEVMTFEA